jgi:hypothetical protein
MAGQRSQTVSVASSQEFLKQADRARKAAAILQVQADELFDRSKNATTSGARSNNGQQQRSQALKLLAAAEEFEKRAAAADPLAFNKFGQLDFKKERAALNAGGKSKTGGGGGAPPSDEIDFKNTPKPSE